MLRKFANRFSNEGKKSIDQIDLDYMEIRTNGGPNLRGSTVYISEVIVNKCKIYFTSQYLLSLIHHL